MAIFKRLSSFVILAVLWQLSFAQTNTISRSNPAQEGVEAKAVLQLYTSLMSLEQTEIHHVVVMRHGKVISELHPAPFRAIDAHTLYSASKTFCSMAVGLCIDDNRLRVTDRVATFFPEFLPDTISDGLAKMTVHDLLTMSSGINPDWNMRSITTEWEKTWLAKHLKYEPGEKFLYDSMSTYMLSAIVQKVTGHTVLQLLQERIFAPLGITEAEWEQSARGVNTGGWGMRIQAESEAKFGQLLLQKGNWNGKQLISREWIDRATQCHKVPFTDNPKKNIQNPGYGYQLWLCEIPGSFCADGALGQYIFVVPEKDMVVVLNGASMKGYEEIDATFRFIKQVATDNGPLKFDAAQQKALDKFTASASQRTVKGVKVKTKPSIALHDGFALQFGADGNLQYTFDGRTITAAPAQWHYASSTVQPPYSIHPKNVFKGLNKPFTTAARYSWENRDKLVINTYWVDFISGETVTVELDKATKKAHVSVKRNFTSTPAANLTLPYTPAK